MDNQQVELCGRARLIEELMQAGIEIALPLRDKGVDLIAYPDSPKASQTGNNLFTATPIQLKAATTESFGVWRKYQHIPSLILVFVWHIFEPAKTQFHALTQAESEAIAQELDWLKNLSWTKNGLWTTTLINPRLRTLLDKHQIKKPSDWKSKLFCT